MRVESLQLCAGPKHGLSYDAFSTLHAGRVAATPLDRSCNCSLVPLSVPSMRVESLQQRVG